MKRDEEESMDKSVEQHLRLFSAPSVQEIDDAKDRTRRRLSMQAVDAVEEMPAQSGFHRSAWMWRLGIAGAVAAAVLAVVFMPKGVDADAVVEAADGGLYQESGRVLQAGEKIEAGSVVRANGSGAMLRLADGSRIEMRADSKLFLECADDGVRIQLSDGDVIVNAAKQHGHLYVQTKDVKVSVVGTVFLVKTEEAGSRVAVIEGEVRVQQGTTEKNLRPGEQVNTNPFVELQPVSQEIAWSSKAPEHIAMLQQSAGATTVRQNLAEAPIAFEEASIRPYNPGTPTGGRDGRVWAVQGCGGDPQVDPRRFAVTGTTLYNLMVWAYGTREMPTQDCRGYDALNLISGGPGWVRSEQWDVLAAIPEGFPGYTLQQLKKSEAPKLQSMLRTLLENRFNVVIRREMKEVPGYALMLARDAASFTASKDASQWLTKKPADWQPLPSGGVGDERGHTNVSPEWNGYFKGSDASMADLVIMLGQKSGRPVVDRTGIVGQFNWFVVHPADGPPNNSPVVGILNPGDRASLFKALEQLGLKVEDTRTQVEVLVIEHVERPSEN